MIDLRTQGFKRSSGSHAPPIHVSLGDFDIVAAGKTLLRAGTSTPNDALRAGVKNVTVQTTLFPDINIDDPFSPLPGTASALGKLLKPKVTVTGDLFNPPQVVAPYGDPGPTRWPQLVQGAKVVGVGVVGLLLLGLFRK